jgi:hypothetical protein
MWHRTWDFALHVGPRTARGTSHCTWDLALHVALRTPHRTSYVALRTSDVYDVPRADDN